MSVATLISLEEYLNTSYEPDMDLVDGVLVGRNVGTPKHGRLQFRITQFFEKLRESCALIAFPETRLRVADNRYRVPDVMVLGIPYRKSDVILDVPLVIVEILSPDDTLKGMLDRCEDYEELGVPNILIIDPEGKLAWIFSKGDFLLIRTPSAGLNLPVGKHREFQAIDFPFAQMFAELDED